MRPDKGPMHVTLGLHTITSEKAKPCSFLARIDSGINNDRNMK